MIVIDKIHGFEEIEAALSRLPKISTKAAVSALNKIGSQATTQARRKVRERYNIKAKDLTGSIVLKRAKGGSASNQQLLAVVQGSGKPLSLYKFSPSPKEPPAQKGVPLKVRLRRKVTIRVLKTEGRKRLTNSFVARLKGASTPSIYHRLGKKSFPIERRLTVGPAKMFQKIGIPAAQRIVREKGRDIMAHEIDFYLKKEAGLMPVKGK
jgi:hypothetical protein